MVTVSDYAGLKPAWCPGCGNFGILQALNRALVEMEIEPHQVLLVSGIGQAGKLPHYTRGNVFNSLHGRPVPPAIGAKIANSELIVIAISGDGDAYGEGGNHFLHAARRNHDITYLVHNNQVYGLTKGQASPTSDVGFITKTTPYGAASPVNPIALAIVSGASFVGRGFAGDIDHLSNLIKRGITHRGFALIDILQPCISFNHKNTFQWYAERVYKLEDESYDPSDKKAAIEKALEWGEKIPIGVIYKGDLLVYEDQLPALSEGPLVKQIIDPRRVEKLLAEFM
ncbi:MAG: 2-oxoacid:ferredoxin oxidoreductase subunit beta [Dehalococcoidia bacterium]|nr:2-oxoacid:ferredoxin oxidoreductase subunit beta [Dehalococcoidia bacterium]MDH4291468.1 2-oxoacid:ferredoxin oxidoreductase subunit beta [Dehalococcoidia bacterium]